MTLNHSGFVLVNNMINVIILFLFVEEPGLDLLE